jgi:hypothetical protein
MRNVLDFSQVSGQIFYSVCGEAAIQREMACTLETVIPSHSTYNANDSERQRTDRPQEYNNTVRCLCGIRHCAWNDALVLWIYQAHNNEGDKQPLRQAREQYNAVVPEKTRQWQHRPAVLKPTEIHLHLTCYQRAAWLFPTTTTTSLWKKPRQRSADTLINQKYKLTSGQQLLSVSLKICPGHVHGATVFVSARVTTGLNNKVQW